MQYETQDNMTYTANGKGRVMENMNKKDQKDRLLKDFEEREAKYTTWMEAEFKVAKSVWKRHGFPKAQFQRLLLYKETLEEINSSKRYINAFFNRESEKIGK